jgi:homoserine O-acetyltransferase
VLQRTILTLSLVVSWSLAEAAYPTSVEGDFVVRDFRFGTGEVLPELRLHYTTIGTPVRDAEGVVRNAVLVLHGTGGSGRGFLSENFGGALFGEGQLLDGNTHYIILPDAIGHGRSSKPSDGLRMSFPRYSYDDMVRAHHLLLTEGLGVSHLRLVMGTSMGGMHTWVWGVTYPDFMDALCPLASLPAPIAGRNRMLRRMILDSIRSDPEWKNGNYQSQPKEGLTAAIHALLVMVSSPLQWHRQAPTREKADALFDQMVASRLAQTDANDMLYYFDSSRDYDPSPGLERIAAPLLAINSADDEVNPPELGILEAQIARLKRGRAIVIPTSERTRGHGTHSLPELWKDELARLLRESQSDSTLNPEGAAPR